MSGTAGDRANSSAFAFRATAGSFPTSVDPLGALDEVQVFGLDSLTFTRPANDTNQTPTIGTGNGRLSSLAAPVYFDVYTTRDEIGYDAAPETPPCLRLTELGKGTAYRNIAA